MNFEPLSEQQEKAIMSSFNDAQRAFILSRSKISKKSKWIEVLAKHKGIVIDLSMSSEKIEEILDDWMLKDVLDGGYGCRPFKCECGMSLRFQYIVYHRSKDSTFKLGETCFENYTSLSPIVLRDIKKGFHHIDLERDELLHKFQLGMIFDLTPFLHLEIQEDIKQQAALGLPLLEKQISNVDSLHKEYESRKRAEEERRLHSNKQNEPTPVPNERAQAFPSSIRGIQQWPRKEFMADKRYQGSIPEKRQVKSYEKFTNREEIDMLQDKLEKCKKGDFSFYKWCPRVITMCEDMILKFRTQEFLYEHEIILFRDRIDHMIESLFNSN